LAELCATLALPNPVLLGFSYGGAIVQGLVAAKPGIARAVVLLAAVGPRHVAAPVPGPAQQRAIRWALSSGVGATAVAKQLGAPMFGADPPATWVDLNCALLALPGAVGTLLQEAARLAPEALRPEGVDVPTLVIHGTADQTVAFEVGMDLMTRVPGAEFCEILHACHMLPFTEAEAVAATVAAFVERLAPEPTEEE
jgi:pimeloyl-ACP methyl ester carboxylesterase